MRFLLLMYALISVGFAISGFRSDGATTGLCILGASGLAIMAGAGLRGSLEGIRVQKIVGPIVTALLLTLAGWLSIRLSLGLAGQRFPGWVWVSIGFVAYLFCPDVTREASNRQSESV
jgi:hypothetical protein